jgi:hypothetical protein
VAATRDLTSGMLAPPPGLVISTELERTLWC